VADGGSFGLLIRSYITRAFLTLALAARLDSAILDPIGWGQKPQIASLGGEYNVKKAGQRHR
jgi:hypothetical protein